jgi:hypothetical protein
MSELQVPVKLQHMALMRAQELITTHSSLRNLPTFKKVLDSSKPYHGTQIDRLEKQQIQVVFRRINSTMGLEDSVLLVDGEALSEDSSALLPQGNHQWALISNAFLPILYWGSWRNFISQIFSPGYLEPLAEGECESARILSNNYQVQTQGRIFSRTKCFEASPKTAQRALPVGTHLAELPQVKPDRNQNNIWLIAGITLAAGLIYSLRDKSVSLRWPGLK